MLQLIFVTFVLIIYDILHVCTVNFTYFINASTVLGGTENSINNKQVSRVPLKLNVIILRENCRQTEEFVRIV